MMWVLRLNSGATSQEPKPMTTTTKTTEPFQATRIGQYTVKYDARAREWDVVHDTHGHLDSFTFRVDAIAYARDEHEGEALASLRDEVQTLAADCDDAELLTRIKALLAAGK
jgi:hypothetical protein